MPGRIFLTARVGEIARHFGAHDAGTVDPGARADVVPGEQVVAVVAGPRLAVMRWGMIPTGRTNARGRPVLETIVNARCETLFAKSAFQGLKRAILPVSGWYEWTGAARRKVRWAISAPEQDVLGFAAVYDTWRAPDGRDVASLATVTCAPNAEVATVHHRMPVILEPAEYALWLGAADADAARTMRPLASGRLRVAPA